MSQRRFIYCLVGEVGGSETLNALTFLQIDTQFGIDKRGKFNNQFARGVHKKSGHGKPLGSFTAWKNRRANQIYNLVEHQ